MISYSQNFEDVMLARAFRSRKTGFYIDVGAMDPVEGSVTKHFYDLGWCGINIEPDPRFHEKLSERPRDVNLNIALGDADETLPFYEFGLQGISTFNPKFRQYFTDRGSEFRTRQQQVTTLAGICERHVSGDIDFLKIDAEGWEGPIIRGADWARFRPVVLVVEGTEPYSHIPAWESWEPYLIGAGYVFAYYDGLSRFYLRTESWDALRERFAFPPNVLDGFKLLVTEEAERDRDRLLAENRALVSRLESLRREHSSEAESLHDLIIGSSADLQAAKASVMELREELALSIQERTKLIEENAEIGARSEFHRTSHEVAAAALREAEARVDALTEQVASDAAEIARLARESTEARIQTGRIGQRKPPFPNSSSAWFRNYAPEGDQRERAERERDSLRHRLDITWAEKEIERSRNEYLAERPS